MNSSPPKKVQGASSTTSACALPIAPIFTKRWWAAAFPTAAATARLYNRAEIALVQAKAIGIRRLGSVTLELGYIAAGRLDAFWERNLKPWDLAAGILLVREAGGFTSDCDGDGSPLQTGNIIRPTPISCPSSRRNSPPQGKSPAPKEHRPLSDYRPLPYPSRGLDHPHVSSIGRQGAPAAKRVRAS